MNGQEVWEQCMALHMVPKELMELFVDIFFASLDLACESPLSVMMLKLEFQDRCIQLLA